MKITNVNTVSALIDRLITEKIKQYFFLMDGDVRAANTQGEIADAINKEIQITLFEAIKDKNYDFASEQRTYKKKFLI